METLAMVGITLWWAEGTKSRLDKRWTNTRSYPVELTNTNPLIIKLFVDFLQVKLHVPVSRLRVQIQIHEGDNQAELEAYWSQVTGVPLAQFNKTVVRPVGRKIGKSKGTCKVRFADKKVYKKLEQILREVLETLPHNTEDKFDTLPHYDFVFSSGRIDQ